MRDHPQELEITEPPFLEPEQSQILDFHSALNAIHVLIWEMYLVATDKAAVMEQFKPFIYQFENVAARFESFETPIRLLQEIIQISDSLDGILHQISEEIVEPGDRGTECLRSILGVLRVRAGEMFDRSINGNQWRFFSISELVGGLKGTFAVIEKNANGRFFITYTIANHTKDHYLIRFKMQSVLDGVFLIPPQVPDILRDLAANARKYTRPGGMITVEGSQTPDTIQFSIADTGIGIPASEITKVVQFGVRGTNAAEYRTFGGGFGLTKAVSLVKGWGGRFWIASEEGVGTLMRFEIPIGKANRFPLGN